MLTNETAIEYQRQNFIMLTVKRSIHATTTTLLREWTECTSMHITVF